MAEPPDVLFVVLDSARKDRISSFGHDRQTTPAFDAIAADATVYENAFVPAPWTLPSHCSMFTGRFPSEHGITNGFTDRSLELSSEFPTIAERLSSRGYATAGFSNNPWVGELSGLDRGFDRFVEWDLQVSQSAPKADIRRRDELYSSLHTVLGRAAGQPHALLKRRFFTANLVERAKRWVTDTGDRPRFTFMNLMEAHSPYYPPAGAFRALGLDSPGIVESRLLNTRLLAYVMGKSALSADRRDRVMEYYDASLRYQDGKLEDLVSLLRERGHYDDTLLVLCADHGKTLGEFDRDASPPHYTRDINVNVPLVIKWPDQHRGERVTDPVELVDLFDVITDTVDAEQSPSFDSPEAGALVEDFVPHTAQNATDVVRWRVLADESRKYVRSEEGTDFLFERGPPETRVDGGAPYEGYRERLRDRLDKLDTSTGQTRQAESEGDLGQSVEGQLQDLGYLG